MKDFLYAYEFADVVLVAEVWLIRLAFALNALLDVILAALCALFALELVCVLYGMPFPDPIILLAMNLALSTSVLPMTYLSLDLAVMPLDNYP